MTRLACTTPLPADFRPGDILAFHRRDAQEIAERVTETALHKGMIWAGQPACLTIEFSDDIAQASLAVDGTATEDQPAFETLVHRLLGLSQNIEAFEAHYREHPQIGPMIARNPGLRVPVTTTPFEALTWAITGQQISVMAAVSLRRKLIIAAGVPHSSGLFCYPEARQIASLTVADIRQAGYSLTKTNTLLTLSRQIVDGTLPLDEWAATPAMPRTMDDIRARLLAVKGIGPWTVSYALLRGYGWLDGSLHGDVAVRRGLQDLLQTEEAINETQARDWLEPFTPWRALVAAHLWALQSTTTY
ncbi:MAG: hypothetical protein PF483_01675 [Halothiobacillus sp.]|jgi:DNA-3-methyladenine glycosylase II|nr:hypothetical protein [Halothiobacillus sp.]